MIKLHSSSIKNQTQSFNYSLVWKFLLIANIYLFFSYSYGEESTALQLEKNYRREVIEKVNLRQSSSEEISNQIEGSSSFESIKSNKSNIYFLYGAEHSNLKIIILISLLLIMTQ